MLPGSSLFSGSTFGFADVPAFDAADDFSFDGFGLQNANVIVSEANVWDAGNSEFNDYPLPRRNGSGLLSRYWRKKVVTLSGIVRGSDASELDALLDSVKRACSKEEKVLQYKDANGIRRAVATLSDAKFDRKHYHVTFCPFSLTFETQDAFWYDKNGESAYFEVSAGFTESVTNSGSAPSDPLFVVAFNSASSVTAISFSANSRTVSVSGSFASGTVLEFDGETKSVRVNGSETDYAGTFPEMLPDTNFLSFSCDGTFDADVVAVWKKNYL